MADFAKLVRSGVALIDKTVASLQVTVTHEAWTGNDATYGTPTFATAVDRLALVEEKEVLLQTSGQDIIQRAKILILRPITANGATGRIEPIDVRDKFTLSSGYTGPILTVGGPTEEKRTGLVDPSTNSPYMYEVSLG